MLKTREYKTENGGKARVLFVDRTGGGSGFAVVSGDERAVAWNRRGEAVGYSIKSWDLDLSPPTITIPETTLPEPMREAPEEGQQVYCVGLPERGWSDVPMKWTKDHISDLYLNSGILHHTREAAQQWVDFLNKYLANK